MPIYQFYCPSCDLYKDTYRSVRDRHVHPTCNRCDLSMDRRWSPVKFNMPKLRFERQVEENRKRFEKTGVPEPVSKEGDDG